MNILTLSKEQETKLLELCKAFFPELQKEVENIHDEYIKNGGLKNYFTDTGFRIINSFIYCSYPVKHPHDDHYKHIVDGIHWYQFCLEHLPLRMFNGKRGFLEFSDWQQFRLSKEHPVDYLYNFWQENK